MVLLMEELNTVPITAERIRVWTNSDSICSRVKQFVQSGWPDSVQDVQPKPFATRNDELSAQDGCIPKVGRGDMLRELNKRLKRQPWANAVTVVCLGRLVFNNS